MTEKKVPHVHVELIKAWADGATIQWYCSKWGSREGEWKDCGNNLPSWDPGIAYRVKPEPKPDVVRYGVAHSVGVALNTTGDICNCNLVLVFDGETGKLKDAQVLAKE